MSELINNREQRIRHLKEIILHLHRGLPEAQVRARLAEIVRETDAGEIAAMEQQLMAEGLGVDEIKSMCDLHARVTRDLLREPPHAAPLPDGHPVQTFRAENRALERAIAAARAEAPAGDAAALERLHELMDVDKHYRRKEQLLFPLLERHGVTAPSQVMWAKDDEARAALKAAAGAVQSARTGGGPGAAAVATAVAAALAAVEEMIYKEEKILLPMAAELITEDEWAELWLASPGTGWCLVEPGRDYRPPVPAAPAAAAAAAAGSGAAAVAFPTGTLTLDQLLGIFATLPVDLTFVDADDRVAFFSAGRGRIFERPLTVLGRQVHHCHPPRSVHIVERILGDFRAGRREVAEFWLELQGKFVHIRYFPVRDAQGAYLGTLEVTQDLTRPRALTGERRLLAYDEEAAALPTASVGPPAVAVAASAVVAGPPPPSAAGPDAPPVWFDPALVDTVIDAAPLLAAGEHPVGRVRAAGAALPPGRILALQSGFVPEPLLAMMRSDGFQAWTRAEGPGRYTTYFARP